MSSGKRPIITSKATLFASAPAMVILAIAIAACGNSSSEPVTADPTQQPAQTDHQAFVSNGTEVLGRSATAFSSPQITSFSAQTHFITTMGELGESTESFFAMQLPDQMYALSSTDSTYSNGEDATNISTEWLQRDGRLYIKDPTGIWYWVPQDVAGTDADFIVQTAQAVQAPFDYSSLIDNTRPDVELIDDTEEINGHPTIHYRATGGLNDLYAAYLKDCTSGCDMDAQAGAHGVDSIVTIDVWIGTSDYLPYRLEAGADLDAPEGLVHILLAALFDDYNEPVPIPAAPTDALPLPLDQYP